MTMARRTLLKLLGAAVWLPTVRMAPAPVAAPTLDDLFAAEMAKARSNAELCEVCGRLQEAAVRAYWLARTDMPDGFVARAEQDGRMRRYAIPS